MVPVRSFFAMRVPMGGSARERTTPFVGEAGDAGGPPGDLYVQVNVKEHPIFTRDGANLYSEVPISFPVACLGGELDVPTLDGKVTLKIPAETQTGKLFRMRGKELLSFTLLHVDDMIGDNPV